KIMLQQEARAAEKGTLFAWWHFDAVRFAGRSIQASTFAIDARTLTDDRNASSKRPALQFNLQTGAHPGVRCPRTEMSGERICHGITCDSGRPLHHPPVARGLRRRTRNGAHRLWLGRM